MVLLFSLRFYPFSMEFLGVCNKNLAVVTMNDIMDVSRIAVCKKLFVIVEEMMPQFKQVGGFSLVKKMNFQSPLVEASQTYVLRMCNDLLKRLSRTVETSFCGQVLSFLSRLGFSRDFIILFFDRYLPLGEKSGLNLNGQFNTLNGTKFETVGLFFVPEHLFLRTLPSSRNYYPRRTRLWRPARSSRRSESVLDGLQSISTQRIPDPSRQWLLPDVLAAAELLLQSRTLLRRCQMARLSEGVLILMIYIVSLIQGLLEVASVLASHKLEKSNSDRGKKGEKNVQEAMEKADHYFAKYLTSPKVGFYQLFRIFGLIFSYFNCS